MKYSEMPSSCNNVIYYNFLSSTCFGLVCPSSRALDVKLQHMVFCTQFVDRGWSSKPLRLSEPPPIQKLGAENRMLQLNN